jgi:uncharacterized membrane protein
LNVGETERWLSVVGGGALAAYGLTRGSFGGLMLTAVGGSLIYRGLTGHCNVYKALGISSRQERHGPATSVPAGQGVKVEKTLTIRRSPLELYRFWHNLENLPSFMQHLESVRRIDNKRSHWVGKRPMGTRVGWDAEIITDKEPEVIAWRSLPGSEVDSAGSVHFARAPGNQATLVHVVLKYDPPGGKLGAKIAWLFGEAPEQQIQEDLEQFKQQMEAGQLPMT